MSGDHFATRMGNGMPPLAFNGPISAVDHSFDDQPSGNSGKLGRKPDTSDFLKEHTRITCRFSALAYILPTFPQKMCNKRNAMCIKHTQGIICRLAFILKYVSKPNDNMDPAIIERGIIR